MSQDEEQNQEREPGDRRSQQRLAEFLDARESFLRNLAEEALEDADEDAHYAAYQFARLYQETPVEFRSGLPPTDAQLRAVRDLIEMCDPITVTTFVHFEVKNDLVRMRMLMHSESEDDENTAPPEAQQYRFSLVFDDPTYEDGTPFDHLNLTGLPVTFDASSPVPATYYNGKPHFRNLTLGSVGRLRLGVPEERGEDGT